MCGSYEEDYPRAQDMTYDERVERDARQDRETEAHKKWLKAKAKAKAKAKSKF